MGGRAGRGRIALVKWPSSIRPAACLKAPEGQDRDKGVLFRVVDSRCAAPSLPRASSRAAPVRPRDARRRRRAARRGRGEDRGARHAEAPASGASAGRPVRSPPVAGPAGPAGPAAAAWWLRKERSQALRHCQQVQSAPDNTWAPRLRFGTCLCGRACPPPRTPLRPPLRPPLRAKACARNPDRTSARTSVPAK